MDEAQILEIAHWLLKADHDLRSAERLLGGDDPLRDTAVYHCQQAAEKALKGYLAFCEAEIPKVHLLPLLVELCLERNPVFEQLQDAAEALTPFATAFRYPGNVFEPDPEDAEEAMILARQVVELVRSLLPAECLSDYH